MLHGPPEYLQVSAIVFDRFQVCQPVFSFLMLIFHFGCVCRSSVGGFVYLLVDKDTTACGGGLVSQLMYTAK